MHREMDNLKNGSEVKRLKDCALALRLVIRAQELDDSKSGFFVMLRFCYVTKNTQVQYIRIRNSKFTNI